MAKRKPYGYRHPAIYGQELRAVRQALGLTLDQVADRAAREPGIGIVMHITEISRYERGMHSPHPDRLLVLARVLGKTPQDFLVPSGKKREAA